MRQPGGVRFVNLAKLVLVGIVIPGHARLGVSGRAIRNVAPRPGAVRTEATPPCAVTSALTMARPSPLPPVVRVLAWSAR